MTVRITSYGSLIGTWDEISEYIHHTQLFAVHNIFFSPPAKKLEASKPR